MGKFSNQEKRDCARRELGYRRHVYPNIASKRMTAERKQKEIELMEEIAADYEALAAKDRLI